MSTKTDARETVDAILDLLLDAMEKRQQQRESGEIAHSVPELPPEEEIEAKVPVEVTGTPLPGRWRRLIGKMAPEIKSLEAVTPTIIEKLAETHPNFLRKMSLNTAEGLSDEALDALPIDVFNHLGSDIQRYVVGRLGLEEEVVEVEEAVVEAEEVEISAEMPIATTITPPFEPEPEPRLPLPSTGMHHTVRRMFVVLIFFVVLSNIPINYAQLNAWLGTSANDGVERIRVVQDGTLMRATNSNKVFVMEDNKLRWITTSEAFEAYKYRWAAVRVVEPQFLQEFEEGDPIYLLMKCSESPHIYALGTRGRTRVKQWIKDVPTLESMKRKGQWTTISDVSCFYLGSLPQGETIPPDAGPPPQP